MATGGAARITSPRMLRLRALTYHLRENLLFIPALMLLGAVALEGLVGRLDDRFPNAADLPIVVELAPDAATSLLTTIAGATITTAGVVFSLLVVSLQLASGQFSPRVLRGFYRDRLAQVLIGLLMATFTFCVLSLSGLDTSAERAPGVSMMVALALGLGSIVVIVGYLARISKRQYVGNVLERIAGETLALIEDLGTEIVHLGEPVPAPDPATLGRPFVVPSPGDGWVQQLSLGAVLAVTPPGSVVRLETRVGAYAVKGLPLASIWPSPPDGDRLARVLDDAVIIGEARTMQQDIDFGLRQLNDIGLRALSPAINDPTTAAEVVLRLASVMRPLLLAELPAQSVRDAAGRVLLTPSDLDHAEYVRHAFDQIRQFAAPQVAVARVIVRTLVMLRQTCDEAAGDRDAAGRELRRQIDLTLQGCAGAGLLPEDLRAVTELDVALDVAPDGTPRRTP